MLRILALALIAFGLTLDLDAAPVRAAPDRVVRLTPETGDFVEYPLPEQTTNIRRVFIDDHGLRPVFWAGSNHDAGILKVEPLDR